MSIVSIGQNIATLLDICSITCGSGSPEGIVTANPASLWLQKDGATASKLWQKDSGTGNTGWVLVGVSVSLQTTVDTINTIVTSMQTKQNRFMETRTRIRYVNDGDNFTAAELLGETRYATFGSSVYTNAIWAGAAGMNDIYTLKIVDQRACLLVKPGTPNIAASSRRMHFRPHTIAAAGPARIDFRDVFGAVTATPVTSVSLPLACSISAWLRKEAGGDASHARFTFGFCDMTITFPSAPVARIGLIGDGVTGFRFGSVNCPDGAVSGDNAATDINANSVQPAELTSPGTNWFHVRIKMIPPTPTQSGRWGAYLNGVLQATFTTSVNFPRGSAATNRNYVNIEPMICNYGDAGQLAGMLIDDLRVTFEEDYTL